MADFLTRLAKRTLNRVPVAQPMIASVFAPGPALPGFLPQAEVWSPVEQSQEVPTPFTPKPSLVIAEQEEQAGAMPTVISQDEAAKPGRRGDHEGRPNIEEPGVGVPLSVIQRGGPSKMPGRAKRGEDGRESGTWAPPLGAMNRAPTPPGPRFARPYNEEPSAIPSQPLIADQPPAVMGQLSLYPAPAASGLPVQEGEPGTGAKYEATDPIQMKMEDTEMASPVADTASLTEEQISISSGEGFIISRHEDVALAVEVNNGEEYPHTMVRQSISPGEERPGIAYMEEGWISHPTPGQPQGSPHPNSATPAPTMTTRSPGDPSETIVGVGRGPRWPSLVGEQDEADADSGAGGHKGPLPSSAPLSPLRPEGLFPKGPMPESVGLSRPRTRLHTVDQPARAEQAHAPTGFLDGGQEGGRAGQAHAPTEEPMVVIQRSTEIEQPANSTIVPMSSTVEPYVSSDIVASLAGARLADARSTSVSLESARTGEQANRGGQPPNRGVGLPGPQLLVPHVQAQQEIISLQQAELTPMEGNSSGPPLTRSQSYFPVEQERNNRPLTEQHSVLPAIETTQAAPTIHVTIGRIDVRAIPGPAPAASSKQAKRSPALSLDDYLKKGKGGRQ